MWYLASIFLITESMSNQCVIQEHEWYKASLFEVNESMDSVEIIDQFERKLGLNQCIEWKAKNCLINFCGRMKFAKIRKVDARLIMRGVRNTDIVNAVIFAMVIAAIVFLINEGDR